MEKNLSSKRTILVVEDDLLMRTLFRRSLEKEYNILEAENGLEGLDLLKEHYRDLSLVLLDVLMPVYNGYQFLEAIKDDPVLSSVPVIVATSENGKSEEVKCLELGASDYIVKPCKPQILTMRVRNVIHLKESKATLAAMEYDETTGVYNRNAFIHHAEDMIQSNPDKSYDLLIGQIDNYSVISSIHTESIVTRILRSAAQVSRNVVGNNGIVAYHHSGVFYILVEAKTEEILKDGYEGILSEINQKSPIGNISLRYGLYRGVDTSRHTVKECIDRAQIALKTIEGDFYKHSAVYDKEMGRHLVIERQLEADFESALADGEFEVWFQPRISPQSGIINGAEALVRWRRKDGTLIPPDDFIPVFEKNGLISHIDEFVYDSVCRLQSRWRKLLGKNLELIPISVNLSRASMFDGDVVKKYTDIAERHGIKPSDVAIEVTESYGIAVDLVKHLTDELTRAGFTVYMDDFGTGYASLSDLNTMSFNTVKIDKSLVDHIGTERGNHMLRHMVHLFHDLDLNVVAEGVETEEQIEILKEYGCDSIQGYYYSKPLVYEEFEAFATNSIESGRSALF